MFQRLFEELGHYASKVQGEDWEKCHFMVKEGIVLGHKISAVGLEMDQAKISVINILLPPSNVKGVRSFLGYVGFYRRFIKDLSRIAKPLCRLLEKEEVFEFSKECLEAFESIKGKLISTPVIAAPEWGKEFEIMCDVSDYVMGVVLRQRRNKVFKEIYYLSKTFNEAHENYSAIEKEMLAVVFAYEKFRPYILGSQCIVDTDHAAINTSWVKRVQNQG